MINKKILVEESTNKNKNRNDVEKRRVMNGSENKRTGIRCQLLAILITN